MPGVWKVLLSATRYVTRLLGVPEQTGVRISEGLSPGRWKPRVSLLFGLLVCRHWD